MTMNTVYIAGPKDTSVENMFIEEGWGISETLDGTNVDLVCFTGGHDVHPSLYGEKVNGARGFSMERDLQEVYEYTKALRLCIPMVGICRGGQFLNVMNGGKLIQDLKCFMGGYQVVEPTPGCIDTYPNLKVQVHVDHHQGILKDESGITLCKYSSVKDDEEINSIDVITYYEYSDSLCFQPHPEWGHKPTKKLFFDLIDDYFNLK